MASNEQRKTFQLLSYWSEIQEDDIFPDLSEINLGAMGELWNYCFVLDVTSPDNPQFQHFGSELIEIFEQDYTLRHLSDASVHPVLADINSFLKEIWLMEAPVSHCGEVAMEDQALVYRSLLAPLTEHDDGQIHYIIGTTNFRTVH